MPGKIAAPVDVAATVPRLPRVHVPRRRLWARLDDAATAAVTLVVAPVGVGKTLGVAGWLRATDRAAGTTWIHADRSWTPRRMQAVLAVVDPDDPTTPPLVVVDDAHL